MRVDIDVVAELEKLYGCILTQAKADTDQVNIMRQMADTICLVSETLDRCAETCETLSRIIRYLETRVAVLEKRVLSPTPEPAA